MRLISLIGMLTFLTTVGSSAMADESYINHYRARLSGFNEVPPILSKGSGIFKSTVDGTGTSLTYSLTFSALSSDATASHIHFGQPGVNGGVMAFICGGPKPPCPVGGGTVTGTIVAADILDIAAQGISAGNFAEFLEVLRSGNAYINVHTTAHPSGEIRGQITKGFQNKP